jgi:hypothetical protein
LLAFTMRVVATSEDIQAMKTYIEENRVGGSPFDIVWEW